MLKKFEEELDAELFDRSPNRIHLNKTGEIALIHVNNILRDIEQMKADIRSTAQKDLTLSAAFCDPGVRWFCVPRFLLLILTSTCRMIYTREPKRQSFSRTAFMT